MPDRVVQLRFQPLMEELSDGTFRCTVKVYGLPSDPDGFQLPWLTLRAKTLDEALVEGNANIDELIFKLNEAGQINVSGIVDHRGH